MLEDYLEPIKEKVTGKRFTEKEGTILSQISGRLCMYIVPFLNVIN